MKKNEDRITLLVLIISNICVISFLFITCKMIYKVEKNKKTEYLNNIIESNVQKNGRDSYLLVKSITPKYIKIKDSNDGYYIVSDGKYNYVVCLNEKTANELYKKDLENDNVKLYGITKIVSDKLKELVIEKYNDYKEDDKKISMNDYYKYFGDVYLDQVNVK